MATATDWEVLTYHGHTVEAIQAYREASGASLAEAKAAVERWQAVNMPPSPSYRRCRRVGERVCRALDDYLSAGGGKLAYVVNILPPDADSVVGLSTLCRAELPADDEVPGLVVEIEMVDVHPRQRREVVKTHLAAGVRMVWAIETDDPTVHVFTGGLSHPFYLPGATFDGGDVLPGFACRVADLFG